MEYTDISKVTLLLVLILWVPELENWGTDGLQMKQKYSDITTCIDSVSARAGELGADGLQMNCVRESSLMLT